MDLLQNSLQVPLKNSKKKFCCLIAKCQEKFMLVRNFHKYLLCWKIATKILFVAIFSQKLMLLIGKFSELLLLFSKSWKKQKVGLYLFLLHIMKFCEDIKKKKIIVHKQKQSKKYGLL